MKNTIFWYQIRGIGEDYFPSILRVFKKNVFKSDSEIGFVLKSLSASEVCADFIVKEKINDSSLDPFGNLVETTRISYDVSTIKIYKDKPLAEVINSGRKVKLFFNLLRDLVDNQATFFVVKPNYKNIVARLELTYENVEVLEMDTGCFLINNRTNCSISFKALVDVRTDVEHFLRKRDFGVKKMRFTFVHDNRNHSVEVYGTGKHVVNFDITLSENQDVKKFLIESLCVEPEG